MFARHVLLNQDVFASNIIPIKFKKIKRFTVSVGELSNVKIKKLL
jgi:hypothetical protein